MSGAPRCFELAVRWGWNHLGAHAHAWHLGWKAPRRAWNSWSGLAICFSRGSLGPRLQSRRPSHTRPLGSLGLGSGKERAGCGFVASVAPSITVTALLADAVTKACWGSRRGTRGLHLLVGYPCGSGRACLGNTVWHTQKPSRGTRAR